MKDSKDIEKMFDGANEQLFERPPTSAWNRLNEKLDAHYENEGQEAKIKALTRRNLSWMYVAAGCLILVAAFTFVQNMLSSRAAQFAEANMPYVVEDLPAIESDASFYTLAIEYQGYHDFKPGAIAGDENQNNSRLLSKERANRIGKKEPQGDIAAASKPILQQENLASETVQPMPEATMAMSTQEMETKLEAADAGSIPTEVAAAPASAEMAMEATGETSEDMALDLTEEAEAIGSYRTSSAKKYKESEAKSIEDFKWLLGQWSAGNDGSVYKQNWVKGSDQTLIGTSSFSQNGKVLEVEQMKIQQNGNELQLQVLNPNDKRLQRFELSELKEGQALFSDDKAETFIINQIDSNNFSNTSNSKLLNAAQLNIGNSRSQKPVLNYTRVKK